jgi:hypothetical protein
MPKRMKAQDMPIVVKSTRSPSSFALAIHIIEEQFGPLAASVAKAMSGGEKMTLKHISDVLKMEYPKSEVSNEDTIKHILASFLQHGILFKTSVSVLEKEGSTLFTLDVDAILFRLRYSKMCDFLQHVKYKHDKDKGIAAAEIFTILWRKGRINQSELLAKAETSLKGTTIRSTIYSVFTELQKNQYIQNAPKLIEIGDVTETEDGDDEERSSKRQRVDMKVPLRVNTERFLKSFRIQAYRDTCKDLINIHPNIKDKDEAHKVLSDFFDAVESEGGDVAKSVRVESFVSKQNDNKTKKALSDLSVASQINLPTILIHKSEGKQVFYRLSWKNVLKRMRRNIIEDIVKARFGAKHFRIFCLLLDSTYLEEKQISHAVLLDPKETRQALYDLFRGGFLKMQEVPKKSDYNPQTTLYLWNVPIDQVVKTNRERTHEIILNLRITRALVYENNWDLIDRVQRNNLDDEEKRAKEKYEKVKKKLTALLVAVQRLDNTLIALSNTRSESKSFLRSSQLRYDA